MERRVPRSRECEERGRSTHTHARMHREHKAHRIAIVNPVGLRYLKVDERTHVSAPGKALVRESKSPSHEAVQTQNGFVADTWTNFSPTPACGPLPFRLEHTHTGVQPNSPQICP